MTSSPPSARRGSRPPTPSMQPPPPRSRSPSPSRVRATQDEPLYAHLDWISNKLHLSDTCRDTGDPLRLQVVTPAPSPDALADVDRDDVRNLHANADAVLRAFRKWLAPDSDGVGSGDADVPLVDMSHWPIGDGDQRQASASVRLRKRVIPPFAAAVASMEHDDNDSDPPSTGMSANLRALLVSLDQAASPGVTSAVQLALAVAFIIKHDSQPGFTFPSTELVGWIRALLFDFDHQASVVEVEEQVVRSVRVVSALAVRVAITLMSLAVHTGAHVDDLDSEFGDALESMCSEWGSVVERLRSLPTIDKCSAIRLPATVANSLRFVIAEQILHMDMGGGVRTSHTSMASTPSHASSPHPLTISTSHATGAAPPATSRPETANTSSSGELTPKATTHPHGLADESAADNDDDQDDDESHPDPGTLPLSDLPTQQLADMQVALQLGWVLPPGESQLPRLADARTYMAINVSDSEDHQEEEEEEGAESEREPEVLADVDALMDQRGTEDEDGDEDDEHVQRMRDMNAVMGLDLEARQEEVDAMDGDEREIVLTATRPKRMRQDSNESNRDPPDQPRHNPSGADDDMDEDDKNHEGDQHDDGDIDLARPLPKRRKVGDSPHFQISEQTTNRRATGGRLVDTQQSPSHQSRPSVQPPSFDDLTIRADSTTGRIATPPIPSPSGSRQRAAASASADFMDIDCQVDGERNGNDDGRDELPPAQIQQLDRRPPWTRLPPPRMPGAPEADEAPGAPPAQLGAWRLPPPRHPPPAPQPELTPLPDLDPEPQPQGPPTRMRDPPPPPQPPLIPLPNPDPEPQRGRRARGLAAAGAPAAGAAPAGGRARARRPRTSWTPEEEAALERAMEEFGSEPPSWAEILRRHGQPGGPLARFDQVQLKDKARNVKTKRRKYGEPLGVFEWATDYPSGL